MTRTRGPRWIWLVAALCSAALAQSPPGPLFPAAGLSPAAVRQGDLGSCYFHATIAALAQADPKLLASRLEPAPGGGFLVHFADGPDERVQPADVAYARTSGYDRSDGLWVAVLFRGYAQRLLRAALRRAVAESTLPAPLKDQVQNWVADSDLTLQAYDRAVRAVVDQDGTVSASRLQAEFHLQLQQLPLPESARALIERAVLAQGAFTGLAATVADNGELFGAYRAAGNGGIPAQVFQAFAGAGAAYQDLAPAGIVLRLGQGALQHRAMVVGTGPQSLDQLRAAGKSVSSAADAWYFPLHAYTVLGFTGFSVTLRNPWADHPDQSQGVFTLSVLEFQTYFRSIFVQETPVR